MMKPVENKLSSLPFHICSTLLPPKVWIDNLKGGFQKDEELYFFDIVVKDQA